MNNNAPQDAICALHSCFRLAAPDRAAHHSASRPRRPILRSRPWRRSGSLARLLQVAGLGAACHLYGSRNRTQASLDRPGTTRSRHDLLSTGRCSRDNVSRRCLVLSASDVDGVLRPRPGRPERWAFGRISLPVAFRTWRRASAYAVIPRTRTCITGGAPSALYVRQETVRDTVESTD